MCLGSTTAFQKLPPAHASTETHSDFDLCTWEQLRLLVVVGDKCYLILVPKRSEAEEKWGRHPQRTCAQLLPGHCPAPDAGQLVSVSTPFTHTLINSAGNHPRRVWQCSFCSFYVLLEKEPGNAPSVYFSLKTSIFSLFLFKTWKLASI